MSQFNSLIKVTYFFDEEESTVTFDLNNKISVLKHVISLSLKINMNEYDLIYNKKILGPQDKILRELLGNDKAPLFFIKKRKITKNLETEENKVLEKMNNRIVIENFPSLPEIYYMLNNFLKTRNYSNDYKAEHRGNSIQFSFSNPDIAYEFMKELNYQKINSSIYSKVKTTLFLDSFRRRDENILTENKLNKSAETSSTQNKKLNNSLLLRNVSKSLISHPEIGTNNEILNRFYGNQKYVRISGPYITYEDIRNREEKESRKKWMNKNGFVNSVGKSTSSKPNYIPNYVNLTPSDPPVNYNFRVIKKDNWMNNRGFI